MSSFTLKKVLISEPVDSQCSKILTENGVEVITKIGLSKAELLEEIKLYDGLVVRSATKVTADVINAAHNLKIIGRAGTGVDNVDCEAATQQGILVINAPGGNCVSAAELTCGHIFGLSRYISQADASLKAGRWDRKLYMGTELLGKTLAIIGLGKIGREVARNMQAVGMKTIGFDPLVPAEESIKFGVESFSLEQIWPQADYITVHVPLIRQTKDMINSSVFAKCKKGVKVVNCARGGIINEDDLLKALESEQCGGAALDVFMEEPPKNTALVQHPKVIATPHLGASTKEAQSRVAVEIADQFVALIKGENINGIVNSPIYCQLLDPLNKGLVDLCNGLGWLAAALESGALRLKINAHGPELFNKEKLISATLSAAYLQNNNNSKVNPINASLFSTKNNLKVETELSQKSGDEKPHIQVDVYGETSHFTLIGNITGSLAFLSSIDGADFSATPQLGCKLIVLRIKDSPDSLLSFHKKLLDNEVAYSSLHKSKTVDGHLYFILSSNSLDISQSQHPYTCKLVL